MSITNQDLLSQSEGMVPVTGGTWSLCGRREESSSSPSGASIVGYHRQQELPTPPPINGVFEAFRPLLSEC